MITHLSCRDVPCCICEEEPIFEVYTVYRFEIVYINAFVLGVGGIDIMTKCNKKGLWSAVVLSNKGGPQIFEAIVLNKKSTFFQAFSNKLCSAAQCIWILIATTQFSLRLSLKASTQLDCCCWPIRARYGYCSDDSQSSKCIQLKPF